MLQISHNSKNKKTSYPKAWIRGLV